MLKNHFMKKIEITWNKKFENFKNKIKFKKRIQNLKKNKIKNN